MKILDACCGSRMFWYDKQNKEYEHEIINALKRIKNNIVERLKELGVEM